MSILELVFIHIALIEGQLEAQSKDLRLPFAPLSPHPLKKYLQKVADF